MIESNLTNDMVIQGEPSLDKYIFESQLDWADIIDESFKDLLKDLIDNGFILRKLCKRFYLEAAALTKTAAYDGVLTTDEDYAQRLRFILNITSLTASKNAVFILWGTDDNGTTYEQVLTITITSTGKYRELLPSLHKKYKLELDAIAADTTIIYDRPYLIETSFERLHLLKTRANIYHSLKSAEGDMYEGKYNEYLEKYDKALVDSKLYYDDNDDEEISKSDAEENTREVMFTP